MSNVRRAVLVLAPPFTHAVHKNSGRQHDSAWSKFWCRCEYGRSGALEQQSLHPSSRGRPITSDHEILFHEPALSPSSMPGPQVAARRLQERAILNVQEGRHRRLPGVHSNFVLLDGSPEIAAT